MYSSKLEELAAVEAFRNELEAAIRASNVGYLKFNDVKKIEHGRFCFSGSGKGHKQKKAESLAKSHFPLKNFRQFFADDRRFIWKKSRLFMKGGKSAAVASSSPTTSAAKKAMTTPAAFANDAIWRPYDAASSYSPIRPSYPQNVPSFTPLYSPSPFSNNSNSLLSPSYNPTSSTYASTSPSYFPLSENKSTANASTREGNFYSFSENDTMALMAVVTYR